MNSYSEEPISYELEWSTWRPLHQVMELAIDELDGQLDFCKIPVVDLRYLSQDEINCAAQCSDEYSDLRFDDIVIPKIDRSIFNESAGSRKQTYSRLRLSQRREQQLGGVSRRRAGLLSVSRPSIAGGRNLEGASDLKDNNQILQLLRQVFMKGECPPVCRSAGDQLQKDVLTLQLTHLPPLNSASASNPSSNSTLDHDSDVKCPPKAEDSLQLVECNHVIEDMQIESSNERIEYKICDDTRDSSDAKMQQSSTMTFVDTDKNKITMDESFERPKKKMRTKEDARRKGQHTSTQEQCVLKIPGDTRDTSMEDCGHIDTTLNAGAQNDKTADDSSHTIKTVAIYIQDETVSNCSHSDQISVDRNTAVTQNSADTGHTRRTATQEPFVPQLKRRFRTLETEAEVHEFFEKLGGEWASKRMKRKIVDAEEFVQGFPKGWKLLLGVRKKNSRFIIECRKYISPDGQQLASCREVSAYMLSTHEALETPCCHSAKNVHDRLTQTSCMPCNSKDPADSSGGCSNQYSPGLNGFAFPVNEQIQTSQTNTLTITSGMVEDNSSKDQDVPTPNTSVKCSKCDTKFINRSTLMAHLAAVHHGQKEKKTRSAKSSIADGVIVVDGKYECQICHKVFNERHRYTGHVGIHVRNAKRPQDSLGEISNAAGKSDSNLHDICNNKFTKDTKFDAPVTSVSKHFYQQEENADSELHNISDINFTRDTNLDASVTKVSKHCNYEALNVDSNVHDICDSKLTEHTNLDASVTSVSEHCDPQEQHVDSNLHDTCDNKLAEDANLDAAVTSVSKHSNMESQNADPNLHDICDNKLPEETNLDATVTSVFKDCNQQEQNADIFVGAVPESSSPSGENDFASSHEEQIFSSFDAGSVKDELDYDSGNHKIDSLTSFEQFQMEYMPKFSFETSQDTNSPINTPMELGLNSSVLQQEMDPPGQFEWEAVLAKIENSNQHFVCVWCNQEFSHDGLDSDLQADSVGFICPNCKAKIGQVHI
ncbi:hypothetical protein KI387_015672 [Taxus chinensis]|uniref:C2H2-type domain-containing protein n=1 Tax=Taxus chinensis TaxID=29808 RepID=A0AA38LDC6_TAXCH|nr:hypothetical protein KI387_015672 [Taxus chinensis]